MVSLFIENTTLEVLHLFPTLWFPSIERLQVGSHPDLFWYVSCFAWLKMFNTKIQEAQSFIVFTTLLPLLQPLSRAQRQSIQQHTLCVTRQNVVLQPLLSNPPLITQKTKASNRNLSTHQHNKHKVLTEEPAGIFSQVFTVTTNYEYFITHTPCASDSLRPLASSAPVNSLQILICVL